MPTGAKAGRPIRFIILTNGRSGSNFVVNILNQHPNVVNYGEILGEWTLPHKLYKRLQWVMRWDWAGFVNWFLSSRIAHLIGQWRSVKVHSARGGARTAKAFTNICAVGFKDFFFLIERNDLAAFVRQGDFKIIYLSRSDSLARAVSLQRMSVSGQAVQHQASKNAAILIDTAQLLRDLDAMAEEQKFEDELIAAIDPTRLMRIDYQDYFFDPGRMESINQGMFQFLGVPPCAVRAEHRKISGDSLRSEISNLDAVKSVLAASRHSALASMLI
jgi:hypothetical protein